MTIIGFDFSINKPAASILHNGMYHFMSWPYGLPEKIKNVYKESGVSIIERTDDKDKGDNICGQKIIGLIQNETENPYYDQCGNLQDLLPEEIPPECFKPPEEILATKDIGVKISLPQLNEIWSYTSYPTSGFFNIFRPYNIPVFEDIDAATSLSYSYESGDSKTSGVNIGNGEVLPQEGLLFYPHLGGIQKAKEWVVGEVLWPYIRQ